MSNAQKPLAHHGAEGKEQPLQPFAADAAEQDPGSENHEDDRRNDVHHG